MSNPTREKILYTATRLFYSQGFHGTGLNQILKESGAPKGSLYHYFPNGKEQLAIEAIAYSSNKISTTIQYYMDTYDSVEEAITNHILKMVELFDKEKGIDQDFYTIMPFGILAAESAFVNETLRQACADTYKNWEFIYYKKLISCNYSEEQAKVISSIISILVEGAVSLSLTQKSNSPLLNIITIIPNILHIHSR